MRFKLKTGPARLAMLVTVLLGFSPLTASADAPADVYVEPVTAMEFVRLLEGQYLMGDATGSGRPNERPAHMRATPLDKCIPASRTMLANNASCVPGNT